jgi:hypothetical protein
MLFLKHPNRDGWWECDKERMRLYNYMGGHCDFDEKFLSESECCEYESWHDLYNEKHFCPLEEDKWSRDVWISPFSSGPRTRGLLVHKDSPIKVCFIEKWKHCIKTKRIGGMLC